MNKNILLAIASAVTLVTMGAGCTATVPKVSTGTVTIPIKELGITITLPIEHQDVRYEFKQFEDGDSGVMFYSESISKKEKNCSSGSLGAIIKSKKLYNIGTGAERSPIAGIDVKIGDYYISIDGPQDLCTGNKEIQKEVTERTDALRRAVSTIEGVENQVNDTGAQTTFIKYFTTREKFLNEKMLKDSKGINKEPKALGFKEFATISVTCPDSAGTPCEGNLLILAKDSPHSGTQEFYLGFTMGTGYQYYGPFTDDLQRIISESKTIKSLKK